jgi:hypothetical protein
VQGVRNIVSREVTDLCCVNFAPVLVLRKEILEESNKKRRGCTGYDRGAVILAERISDKAFQPPEHALQVLSVQHTQQGNLHISQNSQFLPAKGTERNVLPVLCVVNLSIIMGRNKPDV